MRVDRPQTYVPVIALCRFDTAARGVTGARNGDNAQVRVLPRVAGAEAEPLSNREGGTQRE